MEEKEYGTLKDKRVCPNEFDNRVTSHAPFCSAVVGSINRRNVRLNVHRRDNADQADPAMLYSAASR